MENEKTLSLKKVSKGYYEIEADGITINVSNPFIQCGKGATNGWQILIYGKGFDVDEWFNTKKQAIKFGTKWVLDNL